MNRVAFAVGIVLSFVALSVTVAAQDNEAAEEQVVTEAVEVEAEVAEEAVEELEWAVAVADNKTLKLRAMVQVERAFLRRACKLTADQEKALEKLDDRWVDKILEGTGVKGNAAPQPGLIMRFFGVNAAGAPRPITRVTFERELKKELTKVLTDEQKLRYESETRSRDEFRAEATAAAIVELFYPRLGLTDEQAEQIKNSIRPWTDKNDIVMSVYFSNTQYYPNIPEQFLKPHLSNEQIKLYRGLARHLFTDESFNDGQAPIVIER